MHSCLNPKDTLRCIKTGRADEETYRKAIQDDASAFVEHERRQATAACKLRNGNEIPIGKVCDAHSLACSDKRNIEVTAMALCQRKAL